MIIEKISKILFEMNFRSFEIKIEGSYFRLRHTPICSGSPPLRSRKIFEYEFIRTAITLLVCKPTIKNFSRAVFEKNRNFALELQFES